MSATPTAAWARRAFLLPALFAAAVLAVASLVPVPLDILNSRDLARSRGLEVPRGVPYLYVSLDTGITAYHFKGFALHNLAFPSGVTEWLVPRETIRTGAWASGVDAEGRLFRPTGEASGLAKDFVAPYVAGGVVLYDSPEAEREMARRVPELAAARRSAVLRPADERVPPRRPRSLFTPARLVRITALLALPFCLGPLLRSWGAPAPAAASLAVLLAPSVWTWLFSVSQRIPIPAPGIWPFVAWAVAAALLWRAFRRDAETANALVPPRAKRLVFLLVAGYVALYVARLSFDEDAHSHWLLQARAYDAHGRHVPEAVAQHVAAAEYPYGYASLVALTGWAADSGGAAFYFPGEPNHLSVFLYRSGVAYVHVATLALAAWALASASASAAFGIACAGALPFLFGIFQGQHLGAETLLVPLLAAALAALYAGLSRGIGVVAAAGAALAGTATLVKLEGALIGAVVLVPWALVALAQARAAGRRPRLAVPLFAFAAAVLPTVLWKLGLHVTNSAYDPFSLGELVRRLPGLVPLYGSAARFLFRGDLRLLLGVLLPLAIVLWFSRGANVWVRFAAVLVPLSIAAAALGLPMLVLFYRGAHIPHMDMSYGRLMLVPAWSAAFFTMAAGALVARAEPRP